MKNKRGKRFVGMLLTLSIIFSLAMPISAEQGDPSLNIFATEEQQSHIFISSIERMVEDFWESMNDGNWAEWISYYPEEIQENYVNFVTSDNLSKNVGILTVSHSEVLGVTKVHNAYAPKIYPELQSFYESEDTYQCYKVDVLLEVKEENDYYKNGNNSFLTIIVKDGLNWRIGVICGCPDGVDDQNLTMAVTGVGYGLLPLTAQPSTINVKDEKGQLHENESFINFIVNATCNEIGNLGYNMNAIWAQIIAIKMCGWWAKAGQYRSAEGCDIKWGDVAYRSDILATPANQATIEYYVMALYGYRMVSSQATGGKLFYASFFAGNADTSGQGSGRLRQKGANYLASEYNYSWQQILHYYYDNSSYNNPDVGIIQIQYEG